MGNFRQRLARTLPEVRSVLQQQNEQHNNDD